eukprot:2882907-Pyramimonas_sp.AAC.1
MCRRRVQPPRRQSKEYRKGREVKYPEVEVKDAVAELGAPHVKAAGGVHFLLKEGVGPLATRCKVARPPAQHHHLFT